MLTSSGNFACVKIALALATIFLSMAANTAYAAERNMRVSYSAPAAREIQPAVLIYNDLVDNVARSGIVERLYK
jgi:hypothetical protein